MAKKKISLKVQQTAEKYLASLGSSREQLTDKQWETVANYVKSRPIAKLAIIFLLIFGVINACLSFWTFQLGKKGMVSIMPNETGQVIFVSKAGEKSASLSRDYMNNYIKTVTDLYWQCGSSFTLAISLFALVLIAVPFTSRANRKLLEALIPRKQEPETASPKT